MPARRTARLAVPLLLLLLAPPAAARLAFPGAQGFGAVARGGYGGDVYHVTNLDTWGPGSLAFGIVTARGPRTIVFDVGGTIELSEPLTIKAEKMTIAGQTAPGGITLRGYPLSIKRSHDLVVRYLRVRPGDVHARGRPGGRGDLSPQEADALQISMSSRVIVDHVSVSWAMDETLSVTKSRQITVQDSLIAESLNDSYHADGAHGYGSLLRGKGGGFSFVRNLYAHHQQRNPAVGGHQSRSSSGSREGLDLDFVNNVVYDWGRLAGHTVRGLGPVRINYVGNVLVAGPSTRCRDCVFAYLERQDGDWLRIFQSDNWIDGDSDASLDPESVPAKRFRGDPELVEGRFDFDRPEVEALPALEAYARILREAGASTARDAVDRRVVQQVKRRSGGLIDSQAAVGGWPPDPPAPSAPPDADRDGMPDAWEEARGLDPADPADGNQRTLRQPWTNLEVYLAELAAPGSGGP